MIRARILSGARRNPDIRDLPQKPKESASAWLRRASAGLDEHAPKLVLLGGTNLIDFRIRIAQSHARNDLKPSFWSHAGLLLAGRKKGAPELVHVPLDAGAELASLPGRNAIESSGLGYCDTPGRFPNLAVLAFPVASGEEERVAEAARTLAMARLSQDFVTPFLRWLGFVCGGGAGNPLLEGTSLPAAAFVEAAFAHAGVDLAPGVSERVGCPESIWQSALWWRKFYAGDDKESAPSARIPRGAYTLGQKAAAILD